ncbi:RNA polymerase factor sigma-54 [Rhizobium sp. PAMB 3174]
MALSASLHLRQSQSLVMTPQLMQSIQLLQMNHFELTQFIAQEVEKNPLLEIAEDDTSDRTPDREREASEAAEADARTQAADAEPSGDWYEHGATGGTVRLNDQLDSNFDEAMSDDSAPRKAEAPGLIDQWKSMPGSSEGSDGYDLEDFVAGQVSLRDHLSQQIPFVLTTPRERIAADHMVDLLDDAGYLQESTDSIASRLGMDLVFIEKVLAALQTLDPPGIFARSLSECLAIQLKLLDRYDPAMEAFVVNLDLLARRDFASLKKICGVDEEDLIDMLSEIRKLNPKPASNFDRNPVEAIVPDVIVREAPSGGWAIELNPETLPRVLVNQGYYAEVSKGRACKSEDQAFLSECLQNANWLTRSLDQRARTIMKVASEIIRQQDGFLTHGVDALRPLNLKTVADAIKMHESTVSRVTSNKYMLTPRGLFELKYFFTVSIGSSEGGDNHSAEAVRNRIKVMIAQEAPDAVLSDDDIVERLKGGGIDLARRTVAKYREAMNIPSSVQRRREKRAMARVSGF